MVKPFSRGDLLVFKCCTGANTTDGEKRRQRAREAVTLGGVSDAAEASSMTVATYSFVDAGR